MQAYAGSNPALSTNPPSRELPEIADSCLKPRYYRGLASGYVRRCPPAGMLIWGYPPGGIGSSGGFDAPNEAIDTDGHAVEESEGCGKRLETCRSLTPCSGRHDRQPLLAAEISVREKEKLFTIGTCPEVSGSEAGLRLLPALQRTK